MLAVIAAVNDEAVVEKNLLRSPLLARPGVTLMLQRGYASATLAYREAMRHCGDDILVFTHQDAYLPARWEAQLMRSLAWLERSDPRWGVLGIYGVKPTGAHIGCVWSSGLDAMIGGGFDEPQPVVSIDEILIVLRRSSGVEFDAALPGYHLYATDLVQTALSCGLGAYVICAPLVHNSRPAPYLGRDYFDSYAYVASKWRDRLPIDNNVARIVAPGFAYLHLRVRHKLAALRHSGLDRRSLDRHYDCVGVARRLGLE